MIFHNGNPEAMASNNVSFDPVGGSSITTTSSNKNGQPPFQNGSRKAPPVMKKMRGTMNNNKYQQQLYDGWIRDEQRQRNGDEWMATV